MDSIYLSVVIPCYNEMANLQKGVLDKIEHFLDRQGYKYEVIIVDDGSNDGSTQFIEDFIKNENGNFKILKNNHLGKAGAVTAGMLSAEGKFHLFTDMDQATPIEEIKKLLPFIEGEYDIAIGSRSQRKGSPTTRKIISKGAILLRKILVGMNNISDTQCGFKMFKREASQTLFKKINDFHKGFSQIKGSSVTAGFDVELLYLATKMGYKIKEVPVEWLYVETRRVNPITDTISGVIDFSRIALNRISRKYKL